jgi:hypothetical protein
MYEKTWEKTRKKREKNEPEIGNPWIFLNRSYFYIAASISLEAWYLQMYPYMSHFRALDLLIPNCGHEAGPFLGGLDFCPESRTREFLLNWGDAGVSSSQKPTRTREFLLNWGDAGVSSSQKPTTPDISPVPGLKTVSFSHQTCMKKPGKKHEKSVKRTNRKLATPGFSEIGRTFT